MCLLWYNVDILDNCVVSGGLVFSNHENKAVNGGWLNGIEFQYLLS